MFCKNCGSELVPGAKFCSECGTKVEEVLVRDFDTLTFDETTSAPEEPVREALGAEEAFRERVSFDWSNVIDEPQKKEIPQEIKSPWAATTDSIDEKQIYEEMTQSDDKNRTMNFIDVLKADREERERAALDRSIEYTEVLEIDPELLGGTKPPKLRYAPLYEDVDAPVRTPFDEVEEAAGETEMSVETLLEPEAVPDSEPTEDRSVEAEYLDEQAEKAAPSRFELPDFLKRAVGFGAAKEVVNAADSVTEEFANEELEESTEEPAIDEPIVAEPNEELQIDEPIVAEPNEEPQIDEPAYEGPENEEPTYEEMSNETENLYLDEDLYLGIDERDQGTQRMSRVDAHTLAGDYDFFDDDEEEEEEPAPDIDTDKIDEEALFTEMSETPSSRTAGMTIAAPADEEAEIEALKRRLAELTGTLEIDPQDLEGSDEEDISPENDEKEESLAEVKEFEEFIFEPEITDADNEFFEALAPASAPVSGPADETLEITSEDDDFSEANIQASETTYETEPETETETAPEIETEKVPDTDTDTDTDTAHEEIYTDSFVEKIEFAPPTPVMPDDQKSAFESLNFDLSKAYLQKEETSFETETVETYTAEEPVSETSDAESALLEAFAADNFVTDTSVEEDPVAPSYEEISFGEDSPIVGFAPAVTEAQPEAEPIPEPVPEQVEEKVADEANSLASFAAATAETKETKETDALSLDELEKDLFGDEAAPADVAADVETKKIDKFYTLYRKNEEFQRLLDEEYSRLRGDHIVIEEDESDSSETSESSEEVPHKEEFSLEDFIQEDERPVEDATIYQEMPPEWNEAVAKAEAEAEAAAPEAVEAEEAPEAPAFGLDGTEVAEASAAADTAAAAAVAAGAAAVAGAAANAADQKDAKTAKEEARAARKEAKAAKKAAKEASKAAAKDVAEEEYEVVDGGSTLLTILAVIVAILLVLLLAIILILHVAPDSDLAMTIEQFIENITSRSGMIDTFRGYRVL